MKPENYGATAQVVALFESGKSENKYKFEIMKKQQISIECYHKLNRSSAVAGYMHNDLIDRPLNGMHQLYIQHIFSYIHDDIAEALAELKEKGLCDKWLPQVRNSSDKK